MKGIKDCCRHIINFLKSGFGKAEAGLCLLIALYTLAGMFVAATVGRAVDFQLFLYSHIIGRTSLCVATTFIAGRMIYVMIVHRPARLTAFLKDDFKAFLMTENRLARVIPVLFSFVIFISVFTSLKTIIPAVNPFSWDVWLAHFDKALHGGTDPWRLLQPLLGYPVVTAAINMVYNLWFFVMYVILYWQLFSVSRPQLRMKFFYTFYISWILNGTVLAMVFSSAGPCFYHALTGSDYFDPLLSYLQEAGKAWPVYAVDTQKWLWEASRQTGIGSGISSMPSIHITTVFIFMMLGWETSRRLGYLLTIFFVLISLGSVHLAWHYAADGYLGIITSLVVWMLVGRVLASQPTKVIRAP